jgi:hypothetical protein
MKKQRYNAPGHTPALAGGARELLFSHQHKGAICDREGYKFFANHAKENLYGGIECDTRKVVG